MFCRPIKIFLAVVLFFPALGVAEDEASSALNHPLVLQAKAANPERYEFAVQHGANILATPDRRSFYLLWFPEENPAQMSLPILVTLHGHASWAFDEFYLWHPYAKKRGFGILALQWWFGTGDGAQDYYSPQAMYPVIEKILWQNGMSPGVALLHGFSRGAANAYALAALDHKSGNDFFGLVIANAGGAASDFPPNAEISAGRFGPQPFSGTQWVLYCGLQDENPERDGCPAMRRTRGWIEQFGGTVALLIEDPGQGHGGFHHNPSAVDKALDLFQKKVTS